MLQYSAGSEGNASIFARELGGAPILVFPYYYYWLFYRSKQSGSVHNLREWREGEKRRRGEREGEG